MASKLSGSLMRTSPRTARLAQQILELIVEADLGLSLNLNMTAADVVRDADLIPLYKLAGVDYIVMGVESLKDNVITEHPQE